MFPETDPRELTLQAGGVHFLPILHGHFEFALTVRAAFQQLDPDAVAVEYPESVATSVLRGVRRLPNLSVVLVPQRDGAWLYLPIEPQDALVEAARLALENDRKLAFVDADVDGYAPHRDAFPDSHAIRVIGYRRYIDGVIGPASALEHSALDDAREHAMAVALQALAREHERVLAVLGIVHAARVMALVAGPALKTGLRRRARPAAQGETIRVANLAEKSSREVLSDSGFIARAWECARGTALPPPTTPPPAVLAFRPRSTNPVSDASTVPELPTVAGTTAPAAVTRIEDLDRNRLNLDLIRTAARRYLGQGVGRLTPLELRNLFRFTRNWALLEQSLLPRLYQLVVGARSVADDNFAYEVWDLGTAYPWQQADPDLSTVAVSAENLMLDGRTLRFRRKSGPRNRMPLAVRRRPQWRPAEWKQKWSGTAICSHPPEDVVVEGFGSWLRKKATTTLAEEGTRVEPFSSSLLDGIDLRETIRNWHHDPKLWVRESRPVRGKVGSVVVVFDSDDPGAADIAGNGGAESERYPWKLTWLGEHKQESDMALYATEPGETLVGPGISRCEYGGFLMSWPPRRMYDIWEDPYFNSAPSKAERLLFAALAYSQERYVAYVAARPPRALWRSVATRLDRKLVYLPIGQYSPTMLRRMRTFHVLDGQHVRRYAPDYLR